MKKKRRAARRSRPMPSESPSRASRLGGGRSGRMTAKERVLRKYPGAGAWFDGWGCEWCIQIDLPDESVHALSDWHKSASCAWADAARRLP